MLFLYFIISDSNKSVEDSHDTAVVKVTENGMVTTATNDRDDNNSATVITTKAEIAPAHSGSIGEYNASFYFF